MGAKWCVTFELLKEIPFAFLHKRDRNRIMNYFDFTQRQKKRKFLLHLRSLCLVSLLCDHKKWGIAATTVKEVTVVVKAGLSGSAEALASALRAIVKEDEIGIGIGILCPLTYFFAASPYHLKVERDLFLCML